MSFTSCSSSTRRLTKFVAKKSKGPQSCGVHATSGSRTSTLGVTARKPQFAELKSRNLTHRAFRIKETLREIFHNARSAAQAEPLLDRWYSWTRRCRLEPIKAVAKTLKNHWLGLLNAFDSRLTNSRVEAVNSLIQATKVKARGYGTTRHLITIVYLMAGKLTQLPTSPFASSRGFPSRLESGRYDPLPTPNAREPFSMPSTLCHFPHRTAWGRWIPLAIADLP